MFSKPGILLRVEDAALFGLTLFFYQSDGAKWWIFLALFLWPDLFMIGYLVNVRLGADLYNLVHTEALPIILAGASLGWHKAEILPFALIWLAHIAFDRALGFGLKYPTSFKDTHLQRVTSRQTI
jgi:hypothetical protein